MLRLNIERHPKGQSSSGKQPAILKPLQFPTFLASKQASIIHPNEPHVHFATLHQISLQHPTLYAKVQSSSGIVMNQSRIDQPIELPSDKRRQRARHWACLSHAYIARRLSHSFLIKVFVSESAGNHDSASRVRNHLNTPSEETTPGTVGTFLK